MTLTLQMRHRQFAQTWYLLALRGKRFQPGNHWYVYGLDCADAEGLRQVSEKYGDRYETRLAHCPETRPLTERE